jgi:hypothetical protein
MSTDKLITAEELAGRLKMAAEDIKKKPGVMKSSVGYMELVFESPWARHFSISYENKNDRDRDLRCGV